MNGLLIEPHYLPSLEYFSILSQSKTIHFSLEEPYQKQSFRNRATIISPNGIQNLIVPVHFNQGMNLDEVRIDYSQSWIRDHWGAFYSSYGKAPFFDYFSEEFRAIWNQKFEFLHELNSAMLSACFKILQWQIDMVAEAPKKDFKDLRNVIQTKSGYQERSFFEPVPYHQNFGNTFVPNLSILDLLLSQGPEAGVIVRNSVKEPIERFQG